jgi:hypothetical protein
MIPQPNRSPAEASLRLKINKLSEFYNGSFFWSRPERGDGADAEGRSEKGIAVDQPHGELDPSLYEKAMAMAEAQERSLSSLLRWLLLQADDPRVSAAEGPGDDAARSTPRS